MAMFIDLTLEMTGSGFIDLTLVNDDDENQSVEPNGSIANQSVELNGYETGQAIQPPPFTMALRPLPIYPNYVESECSSLSYSEDESDADELSWVSHDTYYSDAESYESNTEYGNDFGDDDYYNNDPSGDDASVVAFVPPPKKRARPETPEAEERSGKKASIVV